MPRPLRHLPIGVVRLDAEGRCVFVSDALCKMVGWPRERFMGRGWWTDLPEPARARVPYEAGELLAGRPVTRVDDYVRADGRRILLQVESVPEMDADGRLGSILCTVVDMSHQEVVEAERARAQEEAAERLEELESLYRYTPVGLCVVDREFRFVRANQFYADTVGRTPEGLIGRTMHEVVPESARREAVTAARLVMETGRALHDVELRREVPGHPEQGIVWLLNIHPVLRAGQVVGSIAVMQDITEVRRAEEKARERLVELESVYRNAPVGLCFVDRDLRYLRVNQAIADANGMPIEQIVGRRYRDLSPETADAAEPFLRAVMEQGRPVRNLEVRSRPPADPAHEHAYLLSLEPVRDAAGEVVGHVSAVQDVTELRRAEEAAARRLEELELLYTHTPVGLCYMDRDLRIVHLNPLFAQLSSLSLPEQRGRPAPEVLAPGIAEQMAPQLRYVARSGISSMGIQVRGRPPGLRAHVHTWQVHTHPAIDAAGEVRGIVCVLQDVTALVKREQAAISVRNRLAEAQAVARIGSWEWDLVDDEVWWSDELYELLGESPGTRPSHFGYWERVHPDDRRKVRDQIEAALRSDEPVRVGIRVTQPDGAERTLLAAARVDRSEAGMALRVVGTCQDVTGFVQTAG